MKSTDKETFSADLRAGLVVALVALPLCLGISLASGAPLAAGLITGIVGGLVVSRLGGTALLVSGPAAGLAAIVLAAIHELGAFDLFLVAVVLSGAMQVAFSYLKGGRLVHYVPNGVVVGMLAAIGLLLILQQTPTLLGVKPDPAHGFAMLLLPFQAMGELVVGPTLIGLVTLATLVFWPKSKVPGALGAVVVGCVAALLIGLSPLGLADQHYVHLPHADGGILSMFAFPDPAGLTMPSVWRVAVTLAAVASLETLLSMEATDKLDPLERTSDGDQELFGQGIGNMVAGLVGGLPMTGVIVRSSANVDAGGRTSNSAFAHGIILAVAVFALPALLETIPLPALAAVLVFTGFRLAHPNRFLEMRTLGWNYGVPLVVTVVGVLATDLLIGVLLGLASSGLLALARNVGVLAQVDTETETETDSDVEAAPAAK